MPLTTPPHTPYLPAQHGGMPEWLKGADCKSAGVRLRWFESNSLHQLPFTCSRIMYQSAGFPALVVFLRCGADRPSFPGFAEPAFSGSLLILYRSVHGDPMTDFPRGRNIPKQMIALCHDRLNAKVSPGTFADHYISLWKSARDNGDFSLNHQDRAILRAFDEIFTASDSYEPIKKDRDEYTIGETELDAVINRALPVIKKFRSGRSQQSS